MSDNNKYIVNIKQNILRIIDARIVRKAVFVKEFGIRNEFDELETAAFHIVVYCDGIPVGTARAFCNDDDVYCIERVCVIRDYRSNGVGKLIVSELERFLSGIYGGQLKLLCGFDSVEYFEKLGYKRSDFPFDTARGVMLPMEKYLQKILP